MLDPSIGSGRDFASAIEESVLPMNVDVNRVDASGSLLTDSASGGQTTELVSPVLEAAEQALLISQAMTQVAGTGRLQLPALDAFLANVGGVYSLAQWQSPFELQNDRGTCWAFAGAAALEAAYRRKFGTTIDVSEEYIFHVGKAFELLRDASGFANAIENNTSLVGFQGSGDVVSKITLCAIPGADSAPYVSTQNDLLKIVSTLGFAGVAALTTQEDFDAVEFCEQHIPLLARVNARYRATDWGSIGQNPSISALENTILANHEVVCDVTHKTSPVGGHVLLLIGFDHNRQVFQAKNHWGEGQFIEIQYANDPNWSIDSGYYIKDVVDPTFVQNEACWLGNWWMTLGGRTGRLLLRRSLDFRNLGQATKLGDYYIDGQRYDVNGTFDNNGSRLRMYVAPTPAAVKPGDLVGTRVEADLSFSDVYNQTGMDSNGSRVALSRFATRYAGLWVANDGTSWQARHGLDAANYQNTFDQLVHQGYRLSRVSGYSEGRDARYAAVWVQNDGRAWEAHHGLTASDYQATFDSLVGRGFRLTNVSGYAIDGQARYAGVWEQTPGPDWQARHGMTRQQYQQTFDALAPLGYVLTQVCGYRVNVDVLFAAIWEKRDGVVWEAHHGMTSTEYQAKFDELNAAGYRLTWVNGYSDTGIARYAAVWEQNADDSAWQARHGLDASSYQHTFDQLNQQGFRLVEVSGYGDGFYIA